MNAKRNHALKEEIRQYWSDRAPTFDLAFGHRISPGPEFLAWQNAIRAQLGDGPLRVLELACGTGEITNVLISLGHQVTVPDFSEAMLAVAKKKHAAQAGRVRFILADAEDNHSRGKTIREARTWWCVMWLPRDAVPGTKAQAHNGCRLVCFQGRAREWSCVSLSPTAALRIRFISKTGT
jgi:SAM-dependent methyltransferase